MEISLENGIQTLVFYILSGVIVGSAIMVVSLRNIFHSALFLVLCLFSVAGIYILLSAEFVAAVQVLIYVGAVTVLMIFAIMLTAQLYSPSLRQSNEQVIPGIIIVSVLLIATLLALSRTSWRVVSQGIEGQTTVSIGKALLTTYVLPFEVVSLVLIAALIGAIIIARKE